MASFFDDEGIMGSFILHFYPFIILQEIEKKRYFQIILFTVLSFYLILLSGERSSLGLFIIFIIVLLLAFNHLFSLKKIIFIFFIFFLSITSVFVFSNEFKQRYLNKTFFEMKNFTDGINKEFEAIDLRKKVLFENFYIFSGYHNNLFLTSIEFFKSNKMTGVGPRGFKNLCKKLIKNDKKGNILIDLSKFDLNKHSCNNHPHNYYLQILAEMGLIGILFLISIYLFLIYKYLSSLFLKNDKNRNDYSLIIYSICLLNFWPITTNGDFFNNWLSIIIYLPFAFYLFKKKM